MTIWEWAAIVLPVCSLICGGIWFVFKLATAPFQTAIDLHARYHSDHYKVATLHSTTISSLQRQSDDYAKANDMRYAELSDMCTEIRQDIKELLKR